MKRYIYDVFILILVPVIQTSTVLGTIPLVLLFKALKLLIKVDTT